MTNMNDEHSAMFEKIKGFYNDGNGFWTKSMVRNAVVKKRITTAEYKEIVGEKY